MRNESIRALVTVSWKKWGTPNELSRVQFSPRVMSHGACVVFPSPILSGESWDTCAGRQESVLLLKWQPRRPPSCELVILFYRYLVAVLPDKCISTLVGSKLPLIGIQNQPISICMHSFSFSKMNIIKGQKCDLQRLDTDFRYCTAASSFY